MRVIRCARAGMGALAAMLVLAAPLAWGAPQILVPLADAHGARLPPDSHGLAVRFNADALFAMVPGDPAELVLPDGTRQTYLFERSVAHGAGIATWVARGADRGDNERAIVTHGPGGTWGWMSTPYGDFAITTANGVDRLAARPRVAIVPPSGGSDTLPSPLDGPEIGPFKGAATPVAPHAREKIFDSLKTAPTPAFQADVMILYTKDLATKLGAGLMPMIYNAVATANQSYIDSEIALSLRLVNATMVDLPNATYPNSSDVLSGMAGGSSSTLNGIFQPLTWASGTSIRDQVGADMVALLRDGPQDVGGIAFLVANPSIYPALSVSETNAYSVINYCASGCEKIFAHEIGHNLGQDHDKATVARDNNGTIPSNSAVFPYGFAHYSCTYGLTCNPFVTGGCPSNYATCVTSPTADPNDFATLMSYMSPIVMKFSNPNLTCYPAGGVAANARPCGIADQEDSARAINETRQNISAYRNQTLASLPGSLQFTNLSFSAQENAETLVFTVSRASGTSGAVSVNYTVSGGTATPNIDFTPASGTLTWADGDGANKIFRVPLVNDLSADGIENITATLSSPSGATGVYLGYPTTATGLILEPWPAGGAMPAGWTQPGGSSVAWAAATDSSADGDGTSLKSGALDFTTKNCSDPNFGAIPCPSVVQYTGTFNGGTISFAYRVSAFPSFGFFEFLVDGSVVQQTTGSTANTSADTGWLYFSTPIAAGVHTLQWSYRTRLSFACASAISNGQSSPAYPGCAERAWIDDVSLPLVLGSATTTLGSSAASTLAGQSVTFTANVSGASGVPTGSVSFWEGSVLLPGCPAPIALASGSAACTTASLGSGVHSVTAVYSGDSVYTDGSSNALSQTVTLGTELLSPSPATLSFGGESMNTTSQTLGTTFTNTSGASVTVTGVSVPPGFNVVSNTCVTVAPTATCDIVLTFTPSTQGSLSGLLAVSYAGGGPTVVNLAATGELSLVTHYYLSILRRLPDATGKSYWESEALRVAGLGANIDETWFAMAMSFYFSTEYASFNRDDTSYVTDLYNTFFNRAPDSSGLAYWTSQLSAGMPREVLLASFMFSTEFVGFTQAIFGNTAARAEVNTTIDFYRGLLGRLPDNGGFLYWVGQFRAAQCQGPSAVYTQVESISSSFALSAEYAARARTNAQYVGDLYNSFLRRGGDLTGVQYWIGQLNTGAMTREQVRQQFLASPEFSNRVTAILNQGCLQ